MKRYIFAIVMLVAASYSAVAQIDPTVDVVRSFDARLGDIVKPPLPTAFTDTLDSFARRTSYSIQGRPFRNLYDFSPYEALQIKPKGADTYPLLYLRAGCQFPIMPTAELSLQKVFAGGCHFGLNLLHEGFMGETALPGSDWLMYQQNSLNKARADFKYAWDEGEFLAAAGYSGSGYHTGNTDVEKMLHNYRHDAMSLQARILSAREEENTVYYDFTALYKKTMSAFSPFSQGAPGDTARLTENFFNVRGKAGTTFEIHRVYLDINLAFSSYGPAKEYSTGIVEFSPVYVYSSRRMKGLLGVKFGNRYGTDFNDRKSETASDGNDLTPLSHIFPNVDIRGELVGGHLWLHGKAGGGFRMNDWSTLSSQVPLISPQIPLMLGTTPLDATLAFESLLWHRLAINAEGAFSMERRLPVLLPAAPAVAEPALLFPAYRDVNRASAGLEVLWKSQDVTLGGEAHRNWYFTVDGDAGTPWPEWKGDIYVRYNFRERIVASVDFNFQSSYEAAGITVPSVADLSLNLNYRISEPFSLFIKCGNIFNRVNAYIPSYPSPGVNFGGGFTLSL